MAILYLQSRLSHAHRHRTALPPCAAKPKLPAAVGATLYALGWGANGEQGIAGTDILREVGRRPLMLMLDVGC